MSKCAGTAYDHNDVDKFTTDVLSFWANHGKELPTWALAMQIVGSFTSAAYVSKYGGDIICAARGACLCSDQPTVNLL